MEDQLLTSANIYKYLFQNFLPLVGASTILAPIERMKIIFQTMKLMSINESEKIYKTFHIGRSKLIVI
jgi:hypothetical protein